MVIAKIAKIAKIARPSPGDSDSRNRECSLTRLHHLAFRRPPSSSRQSQRRYDGTRWVLDLGPPEKPCSLGKKRFPPNEIPLELDATRRDRPSTQRAQTHAGQRTILGQFSLMPVAEQGISREDNGPGIYKADGLGRKRFGVASPVADLDGVPPTARANWGGQQVSKDKFNLVTSIPRDLVAIDRFLWPLVAANEGD